MKNVALKFSGKIPKYTYLNCLAKVEILNDNNNYFKIECYDDKNNSISFTAPLHPITPLYKVYNQIKDKARNCLNMFSNKN